MRIHEDCSSVRDTQTNNLAYLPRGFPGVCCPPPGARTGNDSAPENLISAFFLLLLFLFFFFPFTTPGPSRFPVRGRFSFLSLFIIECARVPALHLCRQTIVIRRRYKIILLFILFYFRRYFVPLCPHITSDSRKKKRKDTDVHFGPRVGRWRLSGGKSRNVRDVINHR